MEQDRSVEVCAAIGGFVCAMHDAQKDFQMILHNG